MKRFSSILIASFVLAASCGPKDSEHQDLFPESPQETPLITGTNFLNAPDNWINFSGLSRNGKQVKYLLFKAPSDGKLILSKSSYGVGESCKGSQGANDFDIHYNYRTKDSKSGVFSIEMEPDDSPSKEIQPELSLKAGQELQILLELESYADCRSATVSIMAVF